jgi:hypothetical protein
MFYSVNDLDLKIKTSIIEDSIDACYEYHIDILDCSKSWARQRSDLTLNEIKEKLTDDCHFVFIERENYFTKEKHGEVGFSTLKDPSYFLFIYMDVNELNKLKDKYNLKPL